MVPRRAVHAAERRALTAAMPLRDLDVPKTTAILNTILEHELVGAWCVTRTMP